MRNYLKRGLTAMIGAVGLTVAAPALAGPNIHVSFPAPVLVASTPHVSVVVNRPARPACPGPNWSWVGASYRTDAYGHQVFVPGHWRKVEPARTVVVRSAPVSTHHVHTRTTRTVVVR